jgi:signal peptidase I
VLTVAVAVAWFLLLRPPFLGGPAGYVMVSGTSMLPKYHDGDLIIVHRQDTYRRGDIVAYHVPKGDPAAGSQVIHRIIGGSARKGYVVEGDNRTSPDLWHPKPSNIAGKAWLQVPGGGRVIAFLRSPLVLASLAAGVVFALFAGGTATRRKDEEPAPSGVESEAVQTQEEEPVGRR